MAGLAGCFWGRVATTPANACEGGRRDSAAQPARAPTAGSNASDAGPAVYFLGLRPRNLATNSNQVENPSAASMSPVIMPPLEMKVANRLGR